MYNNSKFTVFSFFENPSFIDHHLLTCPLSVTQTLPMVIATEP